MDDIEVLAVKSISMAKGMGDRNLAKNPESWAPYLRFLGAVMQTYKPKVALELGVYMATATRHMAVGSPESMVIGVDIDFHPDAFDNVKDHPNIFLVEGESTDVATRSKVADALPWNGLSKHRIGLVFVDSTHDGVTPTKEFMLYRPMFEDECLVVCDDLLGPKHLEEKMMEFWEWLPGEKRMMHFLHPRLNDSYDTPGFGVSIVRRQDA
jgi:cephalosporin hydroxylase